MQQLAQGGVKDHTLEILKQQDVTSCAAFRALRHEHFERLLRQGMTVGQHTLLQQSQQQQQSKQKQSQGKLCLYTGECIRAGTS